MAKSNPFKVPLIIGVCAIAAVLVAVFVVQPQHEKSKKNEEKAALLFPDLERGKITELRIEGPGGVFQIKRRAENQDDWFIGGDKIYDADKSVVDGMISTILAAKKENTLTGQDAAALGLAPAKFKLTVDDGKASDPQNLKTLLIGNDTPVDYLVYAQMQSKEETFTTSRSLRFTLDKKLSDLRNRKVIRFKPEQVESFDVRTVATDKLPSRVFSFVRTPEGKWATQDGRFKRLKNEEIEKLLKDLTESSVTGFTSEDPKIRSRLNAGQPAARIALRFKDGGTGADTKLAPQTWTLTRALDPNRGSASKDNTQKSFLWLEGTDSTFEVPDTFRDQFAFDLSRFRSKKVLDVAFSEIEEISYGSGAQTIEIKKKDGVWFVKATDGTAVIEAKAKESAVDTMRNQLAGLEVVNFIDDATPTSLGISRPTRSVQVTKAGSSAPMLVMIGRSVRPGEWALKSESMESAGAAKLNVDEVFPMDVQKLLDAPPPAESNNAGAGPSPSNASPQAQGAKKVKLEPTVKTTKEIRKLPASFVKTATKYSAVITLTDGRSFSIEFNAEKAPYTVSNFLHLARNQFYNGVKFHRVIAGFMAQGGDPQGAGYGGPGYEFDTEANDLKHERGVISMANKGTPTSNGSQFFITFAPQAHLDGKHTVFGKVTSGMEVVDSLKVGDVMKTVEVFEEAL